MDNKHKFEDGSYINYESGEFETGSNTSAVSNTSSTNETNTREERIRETLRQTRPVIYSSTAYSRPSSYYTGRLYNSYPSSNPLLFYIITVILSLAATWGLSMLASFLLFDKNIFGFSTIPDWFDSVEGFLMNIAPYVILLSGLVGCFWYNISKSDFDSFKDIILPVLSGVAACLIICIGIAIITLVVIVIIAIIPVIIGIIVLLFLIGA